MMEVVETPSQADRMPTDEMIIRLFWIVDDELQMVNNRSDAHLYPSEIGTIGLLSAFKGGRFRAFHRWLHANYRHLFPELPERSRLQRLIGEYAELADYFLKQPSVFTVVDTYGIELIHARREGRSPRQIGRKGKSNGRWIVGIKLGWLINDAGYGVNWGWDTAEAPDNAFRTIATRYKDETIALCDFGFRERGEEQHNLKFCERGRWNERFVIETNLSWVTERFNAKKL